jgi:hypothetical protein
MKTPSIEVSSELKDYELLTALSHGLGMLWHNPEYLINTLRNSKNVSLKMGERAPKSRGFYQRMGYVLPVAVDGRVEYEIGVPEEITSQDEIGTFAEEVTHLFHLILNPHLQKQLIDSSKLEKQLTDLGFGAESLMTNVIVSTDFISDIRSILIKYEDLLEETTKPKLVDILTKYFRNELRISRLRFTGDDLAIYAEYALRSGLIPELTEDDIRKLRVTLAQINEIGEEHNKLHIDFADKETKTDDERTQYLEDSRRLSDKERELETSASVTNISDMIIKRLEAYSDEELEAFAETVGLNGLMESIWLSELVNKLKKIPDEIGRPFALSVMQNSTGKIIERLHWDMRPGGYYSTKEEMDTWLAAGSEDEKRSMIINRLDSYSANSLNKLVLVILEEEISKIYCGSVSEASAMSSNLFWDIAEGSNLGSNPEYVRANAEAIQKELASNNTLGSDEFQDLTLGRTGNTKPHISGQIRDIISGRTDLIDTRMATVRAATETNVRTRFNDDVSYSAVHHTIYSHIEATRRILSKGREIKDVLNLTPYLNSLWQQIEYISISKTMLLELVAKAAVKYLTGEEPDIADDSGFVSPYGLHLAAADENKQSPWLPFINAMVDFLSKYDSYGYVKILQCKDIPAIAKLVGYEA